MKELMQRILNSNDRGLIDNVLREASLIIKTNDGRVLKYAGNGMVKNNKNGLEDLSIDSIESIYVGELPNVPTPVLSTKDCPNGVPVGVSKATASSAGTPGQKGHSFKTK